MLHPFTFGPGEVLCRQGDYCIDTFIISEGLLRGTTSGRQLRRTLSVSQSSYIHPSTANLARQRCIYPFTFIITQSWDECAYGRMHEGMIA